MRKLFLYQGSFDKDGNWSDNAVELDKEFKDGWEISFPLLSDLKFTKTKNESDLISEKHVVQYVLVKTYGDEALKLEIGKDLIPLVDKTIKGNLLDEIENARKNNFFQKIRILDYTRLDPNEYQLFSYDVRVAKAFINEVDSFDEKVSAIVKTITNYIQGKSCS